MEKDLKKKIVIYTKDDFEKLEIGTKIHEQLLGKPDYIDCRVILNIDEKRKVKVYIYDDCSENIEITI